MPHFPSLKNGDDKRSNFVGFIVRIKGVKCLVQCLVLSICCHYCDDYWYYSYSLGERREGQEVLNLRKILRINRNLKRRKLFPNSTLGITGS